MAACLPCAICARIAAFRCRRAGSTARQVTCKYHGWSFEPCSGQCTEIPSLTDADTLDADEDLCRRVSLRGARRLRVGLSAGAGRGTAWTRLELPPVPEVPKFSAQYHSAHLSADLPCNVDHGIIGLMDPAHGPFVHQSWWWRSQGSIHAKEKHFEPIRTRRTTAATRAFAWRRMHPAATACRTSCWATDEPVTTTIDFRAAQPPLRDHPRGQQVVRQPDHGDAGDAVDLPHRCAARHGMCLTGSRFSRRC